MKSTPRYIRNSRHVRYAICDKELHVYNDKAVEQKLNLDEKIKFLESKHLSKESIQQQTLANLLNVKLKGTDCEKVQQDIEEQITERKIPEVNEIQLNNDESKDDNENFQSWSFDSEDQNNNFYPYSSENDDYQFM